MAEPSERKAELIAALAGSRVAFGQNLRAVRHDLDVPSHLKHGFHRHKTLFLTGAAGVGWVLARLPFGRKKVYIERSGERSETRKIKEAGEFGFLGLVFVVLKFLFSVFRPALAAIAAKKISTLAENYDRPRTR